MAHNEMAHNEMAHKEMAHKEMAHNEMAHTEMAHNEMAHKGRDHKGNRRFLLILFWVININISIYKIYYLERMTEIIMYTYNQITDLIFGGNDYELPEDVLATISTLQGFLPDQPPINEYKSNPAHYSDKPAYKKEGPKYTNMPHQRQNSSGGGRQRQRNGGGGQANSGGGGSDWAVLRNFKTTQIDEKQGIEKTLNLIRMTLNKISNKNYDAPRDTILQYIQEIIDAKGVSDSSESESDSDEDKSRSNVSDNLLYITKSIFDIASTNKFYSEIYATLYKDLIAAHSIFRELLSGFVQKYVDTFRQIQYVDADDNYDEFCEYTKMCDQQKATSAFITNLLKMGVLEPAEMFKIIHGLYVFSLETMAIPDKENETEELAECMSILISQGKSSLCTNETWTTEVVPMCNALANMKGGDYKSLTSRAIFKYVDIRGTL